jgi:hypothetical protein
VVQAGDGTIEGDEDEALFGFGLSELADELGALVLKEHSVSSDKVLQKNSDNRLVERKQTQLLADCQNTSSQ